MKTSNTSRFKSRYRKLFLMLADLSLISAGYLVAWLVMMRRIPLGEYIGMMALGYVCFAAVFFVSFLAFGMYGSLWRYAEAYEFIKCLLASICAAAVFVAVTWVWLVPPYTPSRIPVTVYFLSAILAGIGTLFMRMGYRAYRATRLGSKTVSGVKRVMVVGAGETGNAVIQDLQRDPSQRYNVVCAVDDDPQKQGRMIQRVKIHGPAKNIPHWVDLYAVDIIILAIPSATNSAKRRISGICAKTKCQLKKVPDLFEFVTDAYSIVSQIQDVSVEDLLGREVININTGESTYISGKTVLVTGAGGSIGSELCRQISAHGAKRLIMLDIYENNLYDIQQELLRKYRDRLSLHAEVASVRDKAKLDLIFERYKPQIVYHAAAHKHVPLMESAPEEAVKNNIFGTFNTARCAEKHGAERFVMISTDKAVNPANVMGATKRVCEMIIQSMAKTGKTEFAAVRFGNVLGSNGSVIPLFKAQIASGGPVTVTHPEIIRYFMTIPEAVNLVLTAGEMAKGGEIFVLDMGEPIKILDLAETLIRLSGYEPYKGIEIKFTGLRPGEKLFEELLMDEEGIQKTANKKIYIGKPIDISPEYLFEFLNQMKIMADGNDMIGLVQSLRELVPSYEERDENDCIAASNES